MITQLEADRGEDEDEDDQADPDEEDDGGVQEQELDMERSGLLLGLKLVRRKSIAARCT